MRQVWQHVKSGERIVVTLAEDGEIMDAVGPLHHSDIAQCLAEDFDGDLELVDDLREDSHLWHMVFSARDSERESVESLYSVLQF